MTKLVTRVASYLENRDYAPLALCFVILVVACLPFNSSLWLDETISAWVISGHSASDVALRAISFQGQSPFYYLILLAISKLFGQGEIALRALSLVCFAGTLFLLFEIASFLFSKKVAALSVICLTSLDVVLIAAISARPYSLALFFSLFSFYCLICWAQSGTWRWALAYVISTVSVFYCHYLFIGVLLPEFVFLLTLSPDKRKISWVHWIVAFVATMLICIPGLSHFFFVSGRGKEIFFGSAPNVLNLIRALFPINVVIALVLSSVLGLVFFGASKIFRREVQAKGSATIVLWYLIPICSLFTVSVLFYFGTGSGGMFSPRYVLWSMPAFVILVALFFFSDSNQHRRAWTIIIFTGFLLFHSFERNWQFEDWRGATKAVNTFSKGGDGPVFLYSGLFELQDGQVMGDPDYASYLAAPFSYYPVKRELSLIPYVDPENQDDLNAQLLKITLQNSLAGKKDCILVTLREKLPSKTKAPNANPFRSPDSYFPYFEKEGFKVLSEMRFGLVSVVRLGKGLE